MFATKKYEDGEFCPLVKDSCVRHACAWYTKVLGSDPQTKKDIERYACAIAWLPLLSVENSNQQRVTGAAVDKVATQIKKSRSEFVGALPDEARERLVRNDVHLLDKAAENGN